MSRVNVPDRVLKQAQACLADNIACGLFGAGQPWGEIMAANTLAESAAGPCTIRPRRDSPSGARVELHFTYGEVRTAALLDAHGTPADPRSDAERRQRFQQLAAAAMAPAAVDVIWDVVSQIDTLPSVRALSRALRG